MKNVYLNRPPVLSSQQAPVRTLGTGELIVCYTRMYHMPLLAEYLICNDVL